MKTSQTIRKTKLKNKKRQSLQPTLNQTLLILLIVRKATTTQASAKYPAPNSDQRVRSGGRRRLVIHVIDHLLNVTETDAKQALMLTQPVVVEEDCGELKMMGKRRQVSSH